MFADDEKRLVEEVFNNAVDCLSDEDKKLPQVRRALQTPTLLHIHKFLCSAKMYIAAHVVSADSNTPPVVLLRFC